MTVDPNAGAGTQQPPAQAGGTTAVQPAQTATPAAEPITGPDTGATVQTPVASGGDGGYVPELAVASIGGSGNGDLNDPDD
jgi:hypothetical protein